MKDIHSLENMTDLELVDFLASLNKEATQLHNSQMSSIK
jgi:hypothetical protein